MGLKRWLRLAVVTLCLASGGLVMAAAPAHAADPCSLRFDWYRTSYEVVASGVVSCNTVAREVRLHLKMTTPVTVTHERFCENTWNCNTAVYARNTSETQQYCVTATSQYRITQHDFLTYWLGPTTECYWA